MTGLPELPPGVTRLPDLGTLLTISESATRLGVSAKTVRRMITRGELPGAHKAPMPTGKGEQWLVPVAALDSPQAKQRTEPAPDLHAQEIESLRAKVTELEHALDTQRALADERAHALEQLHLTVRLALNAGQTQQRRRLFRRGTKTPN
jgi:excisionase family DNA binding protein